MDIGKTTLGNLSLSPVRSTPRTEGVPSPLENSALQPSEPGQQATSEDSLNTAVAELRTIVQQVQRNLDFSIDKSTGDVVVKVIDGESGKVVRQFPSEELLRLSERLEDMRSLMQGTKA